MRKIFSGITQIIGFLVLVFVLVGIGSVMGRMAPENARIEKDSILKMNLEGVILDGKTFLDDLDEYAANKKIKGILIHINSPGGVVGASQEIYSEIKRLRDELNKPVVAAITSVGASGAYYAAVGADKIVVNPGAIVGSIGVIMEFANMERLYDWAKIQRYSISTGPYKDSGAEYRSMRQDERELFQTMMNEVHSQFKGAVMTGRKLTSDIVDKYSDGRVFTGQTAVKLGFVDQVGTYKDALRVVSEMAGLGDDPEVFIPPKKRANFFEYLSESQVSSVDKTIERIFKTKAMGQPMYLMPGAFGY